MENLLIVGGLLAVVLSPAGVHYAIDLITDFLI